MTPEELHAEWHEGESTGLRPQRIKEVRETLMEVTGRTVPRHVPEIESWLGAMKSQLTREINEAVEDGE